MPAFENRAMSSARSSTPPSGNGRLRPADNFYRGLTAQLLSRKTPGAPAKPELIARQLWPDDQVTPAWITRAATSPADTTTAGWASPLVQQSFPDALAAMAPAWASAALYKRFSMQLAFSRRSGVILVPGLLPAAGLGAFVAEGGPIPVIDATVANVALYPRKLASIIVFSRELFTYSVANFETIVRSMMAESLGLTLDVGMFSAAAATATTPAGLRNGIAAITAASASPSATEAMYEDIGNLAAAVSGVAGNSGITIVASPAQGARLRTQLPADFRFEVLVSSALASGEVMAIATAGLAFALDPAPSFLFSEQATLHMEETTPLAIGTAGSPATVAAPVRSTFQTDCIALRMIMPVNWAPRTANAVAWVSGTNW